MPGILVQDPAQCAAGQTSCVREIKSAVEVAGSDRTRFVVDDGVRVSETINGGAFSDPDIFFNGTEWVLYVSRGPSVHAYSFPLLQGSCAFGGIVSNNLGGVPAGLRVADGLIATYVHSLVGASVEIRRANSTTDASAITTFQTALTAQSIGLGNHAESPGLALNTSGIACATCSDSSAAAATSTVPTASSGAAPTQSNVKMGSACSKAGLSSKLGKIILVCKQSGKKLVWAKS